MRERADFEAMYEADPDPFGVATRWYERRKQQVLLACLTLPHYRQAWDCACGTGHLTQALGRRCDAVLASDASREAVRLTSQVTLVDSEIRCEVSSLPEAPSGSGEVDLTVVAEVLYYLDEDDRTRTLAMLAAQRGEIASVHWRHDPHDAHLSGAAVTDELDRALSSGWRRVVRHEDEDFVVGVWRERGGEA